MAWSVADLGVDYGLISPIMACIIVNKLDIALPELAVEPLQFSVHTGSGGAGGAGGVFTSPAATGRASTRIVRKTHSDLRIWE